MKKIYSLLPIFTFCFYFATAQKPVANFTSTDSSICLGSCINFIDLSTNNPTSWHWIFQGVTPSSSTINDPYKCYSNAGSYNVTLIVANSFGSDTLTKVNYIVVENYPSPPPPTITVHGFCDTLFTSTDTSYVAYQWYKDTTLIPGATDIYLVTQVRGNYAVEVCNRGGCCVEAGISEICEGINNLIDQKVITLYPTPTASQLTIHSSHYDDGVIRISITNVFGEIMQEENLKWSNDISININNLSSGIYFLQLKTESGIVTKKFVKE